MSGEWMLQNAWLIPLVPAVSFVLILMFGRHLPRKGAEIGILAVGSSLAMSIGAIFQWIDRVNSAAAPAAPTAHGAAEAVGEHAPAAGHLVEAATSEHAVNAVSAVTGHITWWQSGGTQFTAGIQIDGLAVMMLFVVTLVSFLVHVYSTAYMHDDRRYTHFFAALSLFSAAMLLLVVADNTVQLLTGWELVGLCSFMLIGHWWEERPNSDAALKAFFTTRTGDIGLLVGIGLIYFATGSFNITEINTAALSGEVSHGLLLAGAACLFLGVIGKSGQFPLHTWLPDAMAGPTPVSALIHAATMVVAGVYLVARLYGVFWAGFSIDAGGVNPMALIGGITLLMAAALAFAQDDIKKVLAYSTISQLGYMVMALGVGAWTAGVFHLFTHAFFKALLFLGAGSVSHSGSHHSFDMKKDMGGLKAHMPQTYKTFLIGSAALAGIPPLAGFWSKDEILTTAGEGGYSLFLIVGLIGAFMTAAYMTRCVYLTFFGEYRGHGHPHESPKAITVPLWILAAFSIGAGFLNAAPLNIEKFKEWVQPTVAFPSVVHAEFSYVTAAISVLIALGGIATGVAYWFKKMGPIGLTERSSAAKAGHGLLVNKYYLDVLYTDIIVGTIKGPIARGLYRFDQSVIDGTLRRIGRGAKALGQIVYDVIDQAGVDRAVNAIGTGASAAGSGLGYAQSGRVQRYALIAFAGVGVIAVALALTNI